MGNVPLLSQAWRTTESNSLLSYLCKPQFSPNRPFLTVIHLTSFAIDAVRKLTASYGLAEFYHAVTRKDKMPKADLLRVHDPISDTEQLY